MVKAKSLKALLGKRGQAPENLKVLFKGTCRVKSGTGKELPAVCFEVNGGTVSIAGISKERRYEVKIVSTAEGVVALCSCGAKNLCPHINAVLNTLWKDKALYQKVKKLLRAEEEKGEKRDKEPLSDFHPLIRFSWKTKRPLLLAGETGSGKTHTVLEMVKRLKEVGEIDAFYQINLSGGVEDIDLLGKIIPVNGNWRTIDGELVKAFKDAQNGKRVVVLLEELTRASQSARNLILKAIDPVGGRLFLNNFLTGEGYEIDPKSIWFVGTANLGYADTDELDPALKRRFVVLYKGYDTEAERKILMELGLPPVVADRVMGFTEALRNAYRHGEISQPLDTGTLRDFAQLLVEEGKEVALEYLLYKLTSWENSRPSEEEQELIKSIFKSFFN